MFLTGDAKSSGQCREGMAKAEGITGSRTAVQGERLCQARSGAEGGLGEAQRLFSLEIPQ